MSSNIADLTSTDRLDTTPSVRLPVEADEPLAHATQTEPSRSRVCVANVQLTFHLPPEETNTLALPGEDVLARLSKLLDRHHCTVSNAQLNDVASSDDPERRGLLTTGLGNINGASTPSWVMRRAWRLVTVPDPTVPHADAGPALAREEEEESLFLSVDLPPPDFPAYSGEPPHAPPEEQEGETFATEMIQFWKSEIRYATSLKRWWGGEEQGELAQTSEWIINSLRLKQKRFEREVDEMVPIDQCARCSWSTCKSCKRHVSPPEAARRTRTKTENGSVWRLKWTVGQAGDHKGKSLAGETIKGEACVSEVNAGWLTWHRATASRGGEGVGTDGEEFAGGGQEEETPEMARSSKAEEGGVDFLGVCLHDVNGVEEGRVTVRGQMLVAGWWGSDRTSLAKA